MLSFPRSTNIYGCLAGGKEMANFDSEDYLGISWPYLGTFLQLQQIS